MRKPPNKRKKNPRKKIAESVTDEPPLGGRALQRVLQQNLARGLDEPKVAGLILEGDEAKSKTLLLDVDSDEQSAKAVVKKKRKVRKKRKTSAAKKSRKKPSMARRKKV